MCLTGKAVRLRLVVMTYGRRRLRAPRSSARAAAQAPNVPREQDMGSRGRKEKNGETYAPHDPHQNHQPSGHGARDRRVAQCVGEPQQRGLQTPDQRRVDPGRNPLRQRQVRKLPAPVRRRARSQGLGDPLRQFGGNPGAAGPQQREQPEDAPDRDQNPPATRVSAIRVLISKSQQRGGYSKPRGE